MPRPPGSNLSPNEVPTNPDPTNAIAAANQTVNTLLGRSAKSWMQDAGHAAAAQTPSYGVVSSDLHPKKRRVRPPKNKPTEHLQVPQNARQNPANDESVLPSPALTNEPSPSASALYLSPNMTPTTIPSAGIPPGGYTQRPQAGTTPHQQNTGSTSHDKRRRDPDGMDPRVSLQSQKRSRLTENPPDADVPRAEPQQKEMDQYASSLQQRINSIGGLPSLEKTTEQPRYRFLQEACSQRDGFYVVLHQVFCLWSYEKSFRYSVSSPTLPIPLKDADRAFTLLLQILKPNTTMAMEHLSWFSLFPTPISENVPPLHRTVMPQINHFLARLANTWPPLIESVRTREYPVSAHELIHGLGCHSPVLRGFLFTVSRRALAVHDRVSHNLNSFFSRDESTELRAAAGQPGGRDMESSRNELIIRYRSLVHQARRRAVELGLNCDLASSAGPQLSMQGGRSQFQLAVPTQPPQPQQQQQQQQQSTSTTSTQPNATGFTLRPPPTDPAFPSLHLPRPVQQPQGHTQAPQIPGQQPMQYRAGYGNVPNPQSYTVTNSSGTYQVPILESHGPSALRPGPQYLAHSHGTHGRQVHVTHSAQLGAQAQPGTGYVPNFYMAAPQSHPQSPSQGPNMNSVQGHFPRTIHTVPTAQHMTNYASAPGHHNTNAHMQPPRQPAATYPGRQVGQQRPLRLIPENEFPTSSHGWTSVEAAAHLPQLRSPKRKPSKGVSGRHFQYVSRYVVKPTRMDPRNGVRALEFTLSKDDLARVPGKGLTSTGLPVRYYYEGCIRYRLRCCVRSKRETDVKDTDWAVSDTAWPNEIYLFCNDRALEIPRKQHFHRDLPVELTDFLVEDKNVVKISLPANPYKTDIERGPTFFLAIEAVVTSSYGFLKRCIEAARHTTWDATKDEIARRLKPAESDDIIVEDNSLYISLADPFSSVMFEMPVRGVDCKHLECFDLKNWLSTRPRKSRQGEPCMVDCWKCPICGHDARPHQLRVDDYFLDVRSSLLLTHRGGTKRIRAVSDGSWTAVAEPEDAEDEEEPSPQRSAREIARVSSSSEPPTVIQILDD